MSLQEWIQKGEITNGKHYSDQKLCDAMDGIIQESAAKTVLITGSRSVDGMKYITDYFSIESPVLIYLDAQNSLLKKNYENRENISISSDDFKKVLEKERKMGLLGLKRYVAENPNNSYYLINKNNSNDTVEKVKEIILNYSKKSLQNEILTIMKQGNTK